MNDKNNILDSIDFPSDLKKVKRENLALLAQEIRAFIIDVVSAKEGHLGASLGVVELTIALHFVFDTPNDLLVWDVGHQAYVHKILTGRKKVFHLNRQWNGISGFPKRTESEFDTFGVGHSSTSISAALGMAIASNLKGSDRHHIAIIGDASIASGMAFEGLNHAGVTNANLLVILNDNAIGIDPSVGALKQYLTAVKEGKNPRQNNIIKALNFDYYGPVEGHDMNALLEILEHLKHKNGPKFLHVITTKGKGFVLAEQNQVMYHAPGKFDKNTGEIIAVSKLNQPPKFQDVFGLTLVELATQNPKIMGITPAMPTGSSLKFMMEKFPDRAFDVGIAEQHAVTLAAGLTSQGMIVYCNVYSTFIQRAYDQIIHDVALQNLPVIFCLDRAGFVGEDGATHHGLYDIAFLNCIPNMILYAPRTEVDLRNILYTCQLSLNQPIAIRYPRGRGITVDWQKPFDEVVFGKSYLLKKGNRIAVLSNGFIGNHVTEALKNVDHQEYFSHYDFPFVKPLDEKMLHFIFQNYQIIITLEEGSKIGGFGSTIAIFASHNHYKNELKIMGIPDEFIEQGTIFEQQHFAGLDVKSLIDTFNGYS